MRHIIGLYVTSYIMTFFSAAYDLSNEIQVIMTIDNIFNKKYPTVVLADWMIQWWSPDFPLVFQACVCELVEFIINSSNDYLQTIDFVFGPAGLSETHVVSYDAVTMPTV